MALLLLGSAFFSASEAALFSLGGAGWARLAAGNRPQRLAARLLADPDRLLTAVLFWNLVANLAYFTIVSIASLQMERRGHPAEAGVFAFASLLGIITVS